MTENKLNYLKMRKYFEKTGNQSALDALILTYCENEKDEHNAACLNDEVLKGVTLSSSAMERAYNIFTLMALITNDAEPSKALCKKAFKTKDLTLALILFSKGKLNMDELNQVMSYNDACQCLAVIFNDIPSEQIEFVDLTALKRRIVITIREKGEEKSFKWLADFDKNYACELLELLINTPCDDDSMTIARYICSRNDAYTTPACTQVLASLVLKDGFKGLLAFLAHHPDIECILNYMKQFFPSFLECLGLASEEELISILKELVDKIKRGQCPHMGVALHLFDEVFAERINILNSWLENNCELELDVYAEPLIENRRPGVKENNIYLANLEKRKNEKSFRIEPVGE